MRQAARRGLRTLVYLKLSLFLLLVSGVPALAQETLSIAISGTSVNWSTGTGNSLVPGSPNNPGSNTITITTSWSLQPGRTSLDWYAYFASATAALQHASAVCTTGCMDIPSSAVQIGINGGPLASVNATGPFGAANANLRIISLHITGANKNSNRSDVLRFNINLSSIPQLPADTYTGTLFLRAQATP